MWKFLRHPNVLELIGVTMTETRFAMISDWMANGNVSEAAKLLKITSIRLRGFVKKSPYLSAEMQEAADRLVDIAESNVLDALTDDQDPSRRDTMSRFVLTNIGKAKGWGTGGQNVNVKNSAGGTIIVQWADGTTFSDKEPEEVKGEVIENDESSAA